MLGKHAFINTTCNGEQATTEVRYVCGGDITTGDVLTANLQEQSLEKIWEQHFSYATGITQRRQRLASVHWSLLIKGRNPWADGVLEMLIRIIAYELHIAVTMNKHGEYTRIGGDTE